MSPDTSLLDLEHLSRQTLGNRALEREVLELFVSHSGEQLQRLNGSASESERRESAHAIVGAARAIGAFEVARIAGAIERSRGPLGAELDELATSVRKTCDFIAGRLAK
jgi:HPt (histidine-containing phosphotransfer) domain-containing protein